ncbi:MAG: hypothetical protein KDK70_42070 [Myxococcales bacterium]|nr:hypothetical protein [Myxococcales bacterium]
MGHDLAQCSDGLDNDGDGVGDECDYECHPHPDYAGPGTVTPLLAYENAKSFGIFGDLRYCAQAADMWELELTTIGMEAAQFLNWIDRGLPDENNAFREVIVACNVQDEQIAAACHDGGTCTGDLANYPLAGVGYNLHEVTSDEFGYLDAAWATADWYVSTEQSAHPMHAVVIATDRSDPPGQQPGATVGIAYGDMWERNNNRLGAAAVHVTGGVPHRRIAHEIGHTMGLPHDDAKHTREGDMLQLPGIMNDGGGSQPILGQALQDQDWWARQQGIDAYQPPPGVDGPRS